MVLAMIMSHGLLSYEIMKAKQKSSNNVNLIKYKALPIIKRNLKNDFLFQQDNYPIHITMESLKFFNESSMNEIGLASVCPDLKLLKIFRPCYPVTFIAKGQ